MKDYVNQWSQSIGVPPNILWVLGVVALALTIGSLIRVALLRWQTESPEKKRSRIGSLITWWILLALLAAIVLLGKGAAVVVFGVASLLGLREFRNLERERVYPKKLWWWAFAAVPIHYVIVYFGWLGPFWTFIPVWVLFVLLIYLLLTGGAGGFLETVGIAFLGLMLIVYLFSHAVLILTVPLELNRAGAPGLFLYLLLLTELNDIAQALWGRQFGKHKVTPQISPGKTWEGLLLGAATTIAAALGLAPILTPFADQPIQMGEMRWHLPYVPALAAGVLIAFGGFFGDITMSAIKRQVGAKDSGTLLPGQGGILDRMDSLMLTAPLIFYFTYIFYGPESA